MNMITKNKLLYFITALVGAVLVTSCNNKESHADDSGEKPIQHLQLEDITSLEEAKKVFLADTKKLKSMTKLDSGELNEIHFITYSLERAVAYFSDNLRGKAQSISKEMAVVVEDLHLDSENSRAEKTKLHLDAYFKLADSLEKNF